MYINSGGLQHNFVQQSEVYYVHSTVLGAVQCTGICTNDTRNCTVSTANPQNIVKIKNINSKIENVKSIFQYFTNLRTVKKIMYIVHIQYSMIKSMYFNKRYLI